MEPKEWYNIYKRTLETLTEQREEYKQVYERLLDAIADFIVLAFDSITKASKIDNVDIGHVLIHFEDALETITFMLKRPDVRSYLFTQVTERLRHKIRG